MFSPDLEPSEDDEDMGSNNEEYPKDPEYVPSESPMESEGELGEAGSEDDKGLGIEQEEGPVTPPPHRYPT